MSLIERFSTASEEQYDADLAERDAEIGRLRAKLEEQEGVNEKFHESLDLRDAEIGRLRDALTNADTLTAFHRDINTADGATIARLRADLAQLAFEPQEAKDLAARGFQRVNRHAGPASAEQPTIHYGDPPGSCSSSSTLTDAEKVRRLLAEGTVLRKQIEARYAPMHGQQPHAPVIVGLDTRDVEPAPVCERCGGSGETSVFPHGEAWCTKCGGTGKKTSEGACHGDAGSHVGAPNLSPGGGSEEPGILSAEAGGVRVVTTGPDAREGCCTVLVGGLIVARGHYGDMDSLVASLRTALRPLLADARREGRVEGLREAAGACGVQATVCAHAKDTASPAMLHYWASKRKLYLEVQEHLEALAAAAGKQ